MKKTLMMVALGAAVIAAQTNKAQAHDRCFNPVGAMIGGIVAGAVIADAFAPRPVYYAPAPQPVYCPPQVVYAPAPVYYAPPAPIYYREPAVSVRFGYGWGWGRHNDRGYENGRGYNRYNHCD